MPGSCIFLGILEEAQKRWYIIGKEPRVSNWGLVLVFLHQWSNIRNITYPFWPNFPHLLNGLLKILISSQEIERSKKVNTKNFTTNVWKPMKKTRE